MRYRKLRAGLMLGVLGLVTLACVCGPSLAPAPDTASPSSGAATSTGVPTWTPTYTPPPSATPSDTPTPSATPLPTLTPTPLPSRTPRPTRTPASTVESGGQGGSAVVHAILFFSPSCPHCIVVMDEVLPPLRQMYGARWEVAHIDVTTEEGNSIYFAAVALFDIEAIGVPTLIVGDTVLLGSVTIAKELPGLIEEGIAAGGIDWPAVPGFVPPN